MAANPHAAKAGYDIIEKGGSAVDVINEGKAGSSSSGELQFWNTIFHPNVLGFIAIMIIAMFTVSLITGRGIREV